MFKGLGKALSAYVLTNMFRILSITVHKETDEILRKNLQTEEPFEFSTTLVKDFFGKNISVYAIVGKNGSGKSTLFDIILMLINNLAFVMWWQPLLYVIKSLHFEYIPGLYATLLYEKDGIQGKLECNENKISLVHGDVKIDRIIHYDSYSDTFPSKKAGVVSGSFHIVAVTDNMLQKEEVIKNIISDFFYSIVVSYSPFAFLQTDRIASRILKEETSNFWINSLFDNSDNYFIPVSIYPSRQDGIWNVSKESRLSKDRMDLLLLFFRHSGKDYLEGYTVNSVVYQYDPSVINKYFADEELIEIYKQFYSNGAEEDIDSYKKKLENAISKNNSIIGMFREVLHSKVNNVAKSILAGFQVFSPDSTDDSLAVQLYLVCKTISVIFQNPLYVDDKNKIENIDKTFKISRILSRSETNEKLLEAWENAAKRLKVTGNHTETKIKRALVYLQNATDFYGKNTISFSFSQKEYETIVLPQNESNISIETFSDYLPPSIFSRTIWLQREGGNNQVDIDNLSSGEKMLASSTSIIIYHLIQLMAMGETFRYKAVNIILDEIEICFHPEYQRRFISFLIHLLERLQLNEYFQINILLSTHSPFILSDIPRSNILYLEDGKTKNKEEFINPFAANILDILKQSFFLENGFIGEFAKEKIKSLCSFLSSQTNDDNVDNQPWTIESARKFIDLVGEPLLRQQLEQLFYKNNQVGKKRRIEMLEEELRKLKADETNTDNPGN